MQRSKRTAELTSVIEKSAARQPIDVVVELRYDESQPANTEGMSRAERLAARQQRFESEASPVIDRVQAAGGAVTAAIWLNDVLYVTVDPAALDDLEGQEVVHRLDVPRDVTLQG